MNIANIYRDRTLDMLSEENVGETVLCGRLGREYP